MQHNDVKCKLCCGFYTCTGKRKAEAGVKRHIRAHRRRARLLRVSGSSAGQPGVLERSTRGSSQMWRFPILLQSNMQRFGHPQFIY